MNRELIVNVNPTEISIALCEDKVLVELNKERCQTGFAVGDIYLGKVRKIMPGLNAAFVNIGHGKGRRLSTTLIWGRSSPRCRSSLPRSSPASGACASRA